MRKWLQHWRGKLKDSPPAHLLFVDGENSPPLPDLMMDAVLSHADCELDLALAWAKWYPNMILLRGLRVVGVECIQADEGSNNADIMLSLRAMKEVSERAGLGQGGIAYVAFGTDKGFSHVLREIKTTKGWKSVYVTSNENPPSILVNSASEVLYIPKSGKPSPTPKKAAALPNRLTKQIAESSQLSDEKLAEAENLILKLIRNGADNGPKLGQMIIAYQQENEWPDTGKKAFNEKFGFPSNQPYRVSIQQHLSSRVKVSGKTPAYKFELKGAESTELKGAAFPLVYGFNNSSGLSLPREPSDTALVITQLPSAISSGLVRLIEIIVYIKEATGLPSSRIKKVISDSLRDYFSMNPDERLTSPTHPNQTQLFGCLKKTIMEKTRTNKPEDITIIKEYFSRVEEILTAQSLATKTKHLEVNQLPTRPDSLPNDVDQVKFINAIVALLSGDDEISVMVIGNRIRKMQEVNGWEELGTRSFLQHHGFSRNFGLLKALKLCFGNQVEIEGNISAQRIQFAGKKNEQSLEEE